MVESFPSFAMKAIWPCLRETLKACHLADVLTAATCHFCVAVMALGDIATFPMSFCVTGALRSFEREMRLQRSAHLSCEYTNVIQRKYPPRCTRDCEHVFIKSQVLHQLFFLRKGAQLCPKSIILHSAWQVFALMHHLLLQNSSITNVDLSYVSLILASPQTVPRPPLNHVSNNIFGFFKDPFPTIII